MLIDPYRFGGRDPHFANVALLLHMDGASGDSVFFDSSLNGLAVSSSSVTKSSDQVMFGAASARLTGNGGLEIPGATIQPLGSDYTIEGFFRLDNKYLHQCLFSLPRDESRMGFGPIRLDVLPDLRLRLLIGNASNTSWYFVESAVNQLDTEIWTHIAVAKSGTTVRLFVAGVQTITAFGCPAVHLATNLTFRIGFNNLSDGFHLYAYVDEFRYTKGVARYTANFTPPVAPFPDA